MSKSVFIQTFLIHYLRDGGSEETVSEAIELAEKAWEALEDAGYDKE